MEYTDTKKLIDAFKEAMRRGMEKREPGVAKFVDDAVNSALEAVDEAEIEHIYPAVKVAAQHAAYSAQISEALKEALNATLAEAERLLDEYRKQVYETMRRAIRQAKEEYLEERHS